MLGEVRGNMRKNPHILEINTQVWLNKFSRELNKKVTLTDIPQSYLQEIKDLGFDALWLMGVWQQSPKSAEIARNHPDILNYLKKVKPDFDPKDIGPSLYAIYDYKVNPNFGGEVALLSLKKRLNDLGVKLILDFAGNHMSCDTPYLITNPEYFISKKDISPEEEGLFFKGPNGRYFAHGRDPHFYSWSDTAQLNLFNPKTREFLLNILKYLSTLCDGLRCDMVMLMLNKVFAETWKQYIGEKPQEEFWPGAIKEIKEKNNYFIFLAEVYWGLDWEVQESGFDFTYDKTLYDRLLLSTPQDIQGHLNAEHLYQKRSLRFIANHDEEPPIKAFGIERSAAAAAACYTIEGARLFTLSQIYGATVRYPIQYIPKQEVNTKVVAFYEKLLKIINDPCFHGGQWSLKPINPANKDDNSFTNILAWLWWQSTCCKFVFINYSGNPANFKINADKFPKTSKEQIKFTEELSGTTNELPINAFKQDGGLAVSLKPFEIRIYSFDF